MPNKNQQLSTRTTLGAKVKPAAKRRGKYAGNRGNGRTQASKHVKKLDEPKSPLPPQHQAKPGKESQLTPRPNYQAPLYKGAEKLNPSDKQAEDVAEFGADTPMKRPAQPEEIAPAFVYFASEVDSSYVTGEVLTLLGGDTTAG
jgi:hypothetical protein